MYVLYGSDGAGSAAIEVALERLSPTKVKAVKVKVNVNVVSTFTPERRRRYATRIHLSETVGKPAWIR